MKERVYFVTEAKQKLYSFTKLCERYGITRPTGYKWVRRFQAEGMEGLKDRSRAPTQRPHRTSARLEEKIVQARKNRPHWGPVTLLGWLKKREPQERWPSASTVGEILKRNGLTRKRRRRGPGAGSIEKPDLGQGEAGQLVSADYKGEFLMKNGRYCYPLTIQDYGSRYLLACEALYSTAQAPAQRIFERVFERHGMPRLILTDNGNPFCSRGLGGLSRLSVWWIGLGIEHKRIQRAHPEQNPRHERMHRTLKEAACLPPAADLGEQQEKFDEFRYEYNHERPHQGISGQVPSQLFPGLAMPYADPQPSIQYPGHYERRRVDKSGTISFRGRKVFLTTALTGQLVGLNEVGLEIWTVYYGARQVGRFHEQEMKIYG